MSKISLPNKTTALELDLKMLAGVDKHFAKVKTLTITGTVYTPKDLKAALQAEIDANRSLDLAKAQLRQQVAAALATRVKARDARKALRTYVLGTFGAEAVATLEDFGIVPPKTAGPKTVKAKAAAVAKAEATRKASEPTTPTNGVPTASHAPAPTPAS